MSARLIKRSTALTITVGALLVFACVGTAAGYLWTRGLGTIDQSPPPGLPQSWPSQNGQLPHPVAKPTGEMLTALPEPTASNALCEALPQERWDSVLGTKSLREIEWSGGCHVLTDRLDIRVQLSLPSPPPEGAQQVPVGQRQGQLQRLPDRLGATVAVRIAEGPHSETDGVRPQLSVNINQRATINRADLPMDRQAVTLADELIKATTTPGPALPATTADGTISAQPREEIPGTGVIGQPWPVVSWRLCAAMTQEAHVSPQAAKAKFEGTCVVGGVHAVYRLDVTPRTFPGKLAGLPASVEGDTIAVRLSEKTTDTVTFTNPGKAMTTAAFQAFVERVVPALTQS